VKPRVAHANHDPCNETAEGFTKTLVKSVARLDA
jgi:hypothetical protein